MKHLWSLICQQAITNKDSNNLTLVEILEEIKYVPVADPAAQEMVRSAIQEGRASLPIPLYFVTAWLRSDLEKPEQSEEQLFIKAPNGKRLPPIKTTIDLIQYSRYRSVTIVPSLPLNGQGVYQFVVSHQVGDEWEEDASIPLMISEGASAGSSNF